MQLQYDQDKKFIQLHYVKLQNQRFNQQISDIVAFKKYKQKNHNLKVQSIKPKKKKAAGNTLKDVVLKTKVNLLIKNFVRKLKRGKVHHQISHIKQYQQQQNSSDVWNKILLFLQLNNGIQLSPIMMTIWSFINIIQITAMVIIFSIMIAFNQTQNLSYFVSARVFSITLYIIDMILNFITQRREVTGHIRNLKDIALFYLKNQFVPDFFSIAIFPIGYIFEASNITPIIMIIALFKLKNNLKKFENYQFIYVKTNSRQQYYSLIKVFLLNFSIGHILSILLNLMANLSPNQNWYSKFKIQNTQWFQKYIWGYYWGTNIMLTVGFGDLYATNKTQALCLIFIQTLSCITLAYNISCVGAIIGEIKAQNEEKKKKLKYVHRMCQQNKISEDLEQKINNFIEESYLLNQEFQLQQYDQVLNSLPKSMQSQYRKQSNKSIFQVGFFNSLNHKTILNLAQFVVRKVAHPQQIIQRKGEIQNFCILQKGILGFTCKNGPKSILNGNVIQLFDMQKNQEPKILSLGFIKRKQLTFDIKCLTYSIYYYLPCEQLMKLLQPCQMDYHFYHYMKDKDQSILEANQIYKCKVCLNQYHSLFQCPKYHYIPLKQLIISNYLKRQKKSKNYRVKNDKLRSYRDQRTLYSIFKVKMNQQKYLSQNFDEEEIKQIKNIKKYYYKKQLMNNLQQNSVFSFNRKDSRPRMPSSQWQKIEDILKRVSISVSSNNQFWILQCDLARDFSYYFKEFNPNRLHSFKMYSLKKNNANHFGLHAVRRPSHNPAFNKITTDFISNLLTQKSSKKQQNSTFNYTEDTTFYNY